MNDKSISDIKISAGERGRLEQARSGLESQYNLLIEKLKRLGDARAIETDVATIFKLEHQIDRVKLEIDKLESELESIEEQLNSSSQDPIRELASKSSDPEMFDKGNIDLEPVKSIALESPEGLVGIDSQFYIASAYEQRCDEEVNQPGSLIRIKSPHKMGKSSLMARVLNYAAQQGYRTVTIDLAQTNQRFFDDHERFMQWFCAVVGKQLGIRVKTEEYWNDMYGPNDNCTDYFEKYLLTEESPPLVLAIDNFDRVFHYPDIETDFCGLLRGWYERSKTKKQWEKIRLIVVHSQEPYAQKDINQSPFNVGLPIELGEFKREQVRELGSRHGLTWDDRDFDRFFGLIGGHPYLVRSALYYLAAGDFALNDFLKVAPTEAGIYSNLLSGYLKTLEKYPELGAAMKKVVTADDRVSLRTEESFKLDSMGLIVRVENDVVARCHLYRQYFQQRLGV